MKNLLTKKNVLVTLVGLLGTVVTLVLANRPVYVEDKVEEDYVDISNEPVVDAPSTIVREMNRRGPKSVPAPVVDEAGTGG